MSRWLRDFLDTYGTVIAGLAFMLLFAATVKLLEWLT